MIPAARAPRLLWMLLLLFLAGCTPGSHAETYRVIRVYDGDTLRVTGPSGDQVVRLIGIDCPEISKIKGVASQPYSRKATQFLKRRVSGKSLELTSYGQDKYDRLLAEVWADGENLNLSLVSAGLAEVYRGRVPVGFSKQPYLEAQKEARRSKRAIWSLGERYVPPVVWKRQHPRP